MSKWHIRYLVYSTDAPELNKWFLFNKYGNILSALLKSSCVTIKEGSCGLWRKYGLPPSHAGLSKGLGMEVPLKDICEAPRSQARKQPLDKGLGFLPSCEDVRYFWFRSIWSRNLLPAESENNLEGDNHLTQRGGIGIVVNISALE